MAILGEFDALSGLSQQPGSAVKSPIEQGGNGHGCGHNLLGTGSLAAVIALKQMVEELQLPRTIRYSGCPGEEGGSGEDLNGRAGLFGDVDFSVTYILWDTTALWQTGRAPIIKCITDLRGPIHMRRLHHTQAEARLTPWN